MLQIGIADPENRQRQRIALWDVARVAGARPTEHVGDIFITVANGALSIEVQRIDESATGPVEVTVR